MANVLFVCVQNAGRSQISQALFTRAAAGGRHQARSAGTRPAAAVHPEVAAAMREVGIEVSGNVPQALTDKLAEWADVVVTMGCGDECPYVPNRRYIDWELEDPAGKPASRVREIRDQIAGLTSKLVEELDQAA
jgi:arsenate reductase